VTGRLRLRLGRRRAGGRRRSRRSGSRRRRDQGRRRQGARGRRGRRSGLAETRKWEVRLAHLEAAESMTGHQQDELFHLIEGQQPALPFPPGGRDWTVVGANGRAR
jgi:hypothetical protein